jgi:hypothetical protein
MGFSFVQQLEVTSIGSVHRGKGRYREGLFTGTYRDHNKLYRPMMIRSTERLPNIWRVNQMRKYSQGASASKRPSYFPCLHNHFSNPSVSRPFGTSPLAAFHLLEAPKFLCLAGFSIKFLIFCVSGLSSPSQIILDLYPLSAKTLARA